MHSSESRSRSGVRFKAEWRLPSDPAFLLWFAEQSNNCVQCSDGIESEARSITLAVDEALTNVIRHAFTSGRTGDRIDLRGKGKHSGILVSDTGDAPDPAKICARAERVRRPGAWAPISFGT